MNSLFERLLARGPVVTDGAWGTEIQARGLPLGECPDAWNLSNPDRIEEIARAYVSAGSRVILTNTFGANRYRLQPCGLGNRVADVNRAGVEISAKATNGRAKVFASIGPLGLRPSAAGVNRDDLRHAFREQAEALAEAGADAIVVETMLDLDEARLALDAAKSTGLPVVVSMVFGVESRHDHAWSGVTPEQAACSLEESGADAIGANCGTCDDAMVRLCERLWMATDLPIWIKPNTGLPEIVDGKAQYGIAPAEFARKTQSLVEAGARFVGGCCGTTPAHIAELVRVL